MKSSSMPRGRQGSLRLLLTTGWTIALVIAVAGANFLPFSIVVNPSGHPNARPARAATRQDLVPASGDTCGTATSINAATLPFSEESTTVGAGNDIDPGPGGCVSGLGPDVVYSFTPVVSDAYTIGATPTGTGSIFDISLYVVTNCSSPNSTCVAGANNRFGGDGEFVTPNLTAGTQYFIVVDSPSATGQGSFHFSLKRGLPSNDSCSTPIIIDPTRLPLTLSGSTFGATNDTNPSTCLPRAQSGSGPDVVYQFTSNDTQNYDVTITPFGQFDCSVYIVTNCALASGGCRGADAAGAGASETVRRSLANGTTYFIVVDGFQGDAGDFTLTMVPTEPHAPAAPTNLTAHAVSSTQIDLAWQDNATNEAGFRIERSLNGSSFSEIGQTGPNGTTFSDTGLTPQTTYFYRVFAFNNFGNSDPSNIAADTTPAPPVPQFPVLNVNPESIDFGTVRVTQTADRTVVLSNAGGTDLVVSSISDPTGPFSIVDKPAVPLTITPGSSVTLTVRFSPIAVVTVSGSFSINSNDPQRPSVTVQLTGTGFGTPIPDLIITPVVIEFPSGSSVQLVEIRNGGDADLLVANIQPPVAPFSLSGLPAFPTTLHPGENFRFSVNFSPTSPGVFFGSMNVINNDPDQIFLVVRMNGTSTPQSEQLKLRAPVQPTAVIGSPNTFNVVAVNGTNSDIHLTASSIPGGVFTDRGNGRGDLVLIPVGTAQTTAQVMFTATDSAGRTKSLLSLITIVPPSQRVQVRLSFTAPETAPGPPTSFAANDLSFSPLFTGTLVPQGGSITPAVAAGLAGYAVYRSNSSGTGVSLGNIVAIVPASATSITDSVPIPEGTSSLSQPVFYIATAIYGTGSESSASNEATTAPTMAGLRYKKKTIRFQRANSNVEVGAVMVVDGHETYALSANGDFIEVGKNVRSTPGNLRPRDLSAGTHSAQVRNPHGQVSSVGSFTR